MTAPAIEPLVLRTVRPRTKLSLVTGHASNLVIAGLLARRFRQGRAGLPARLFVGFHVVLIPLAIAYNVAQWRSAPGKGRYDTRGEVPIPASLVAEVLALQATDDRVDSIGLIRRTLGVSFADAWLALAVILSSDR